MRRVSRFSLLLPILLACLFSLCLSAHSQENRVVRVGVAVLRTSAADKISGTAARDRLVKVLNHEKAGKGQTISIQAVALEQKGGASAFAEAETKKCAWVIFSRLTDLRTEEKSHTANLQLGGIEYVSVMSAKVTYQVVRVLDRAEVAESSVSAEDASSLLDVVLQGMTLVAPRAVADLRNHANRSQPVAASNAKAESSRPLEERLVAGDYCKWLPTDIAHAEALHGVCEYAMSLPQKMPNFICEEEASRYRGENRVPRDLITALVRYEDGAESYSEIKSNGKAAISPITQSAGLWSTGEFGSDLRAIFHLNNGPLFEFAGEHAEGGRPVWVFKYGIAKQNDPLWRLRTKDEMLAPAYAGELWVDEKTGDLLRFLAVAQHIPEAFPIQQTGLETDYERVEFADGASFVLPTEAVIEAKMRGEQATRNVLKFRDCHKFRAKTQMVMVAGTEEKETSPGSTLSSAQLAREIEEQESIYAILREDAVREDAAHLEKEQAQELQASTMAQLWSYAERLRKLRRQSAQQLAIARPAAQPIEASDSVPVYKATTRLVPVSVVLRDGKGRVLGNLGKEDFQLFDNGKPQTITSFSVEKSLAAGTQPASEAKGQMGASAFANDGRQQLTAESERDVAYVFDDVHATTGHLVDAGAAASRHIAGMRDEDRVALFATSGEVQVDFTNDREKLQAAIRKLKPHPSVDQQSCPPVSYYMAELMVNEGDMDTISLATSEAIDCAFHGFGTGREMAQAQKLAAAKAFEVLNAGSWDSQRTLRLLQEIVRRTASMPGRRSIVLVSPGFLTRAAEMQQALMELMDRALASDIAINTLDVRGLDTMPSVADVDHPARLSVDQEQAQLQSGVLAQLAYGTGGTYFHHNHDMDEGFKRTADAPEFVYVLGFSPQKLDGKFHKLRVMIKGSTKLTVQAREGYYAPKPASGS